MGKPAATVRTSSPGFNLRSPSCGDVRAERAKRFAEEPELVNKQNLWFMYFAHSFSNCSANLPVVNHPSKQASTANLISSLPISLPETGTGVSPGINSCSSSKTF